MPEISPERRRLQALAGTNAERTDQGFRVMAKADDDPTPTGPTRVEIYSEIGGWFGVWPEEVSAQLRQITGPIELHIHSPGGDAFDGVALYNLFRQHDGVVNVVVDGLAASAASVIAMAGDSVKVSRGAQIMVHESWGGAIGPAEDMAQMAAMLDKTSNSIASIYAAKAGGTEAEWREVMKAETWYTAAEAVEAGLADTLESDTAAAKNRWNMSVFAHAGRENAPDPTFPGGRRRASDSFALPAPSERSAVAITPAQAIAKVAAALKTPDDATVGSAPTAKEASGMPNAKKVRASLGLAENATQEEIMAALVAALTSDEADTDETEGTPEAGAQASTARLPKATKEAEAVMLDPDTLAQLQAQARLGVEAHNEMKKQRRDTVLAKAVEVGKIPPARVEHYARMYDADPDGTVELLNRMAENAVPMDVLGYSGMSESNKSEAERAYSAMGWE